MTDYAGQAPARRECRDVTEAEAGTKSIGEALGDVTRDLSVLFQQEVALAKAEVARPSKGLVRRLACTPARQLPRSCSCCSCRWPCGKH